MSCLCYDTNRTLHVMSCGVQDSVAKVMFSPNDKYILSGNDKGILHLWMGKLTSFYDISSGTPQELVQRCFLRPTTSLFPDQSLV